MPLDGEDLARRFREGDTGAFDGLVRAYQSRIFNLAFRMVNNHEDACELTQEVFVKVHRSIGQFRGDSRFSTWLYTLALNACRNHRRKTRRLAFFEVRSLDAPAEGGHPPSPSPTAPGADPSAALRHREIRSLVEEHLARIPPEFASAVIMRDIQDMSYEEIAEATGCSLGTVKSRLSRGRSLLRERLQPLLGEE